MNKSMKIISIIGVLALAGCGNHHQIEEETTEVIEEVAPQSHIITGTLSEARLNNREGLFSCTYDFNGRQKTYPKLLRVCAPKIYVNGDTSTVTFGK